MMVRLKWKGLQTRINQDRVSKGLEWVKEDVANSNSDECVGVILIREVVGAVQQAWYVRRQFAREAKSY